MRVIEPINLRWMFMTEQEADDLVRALTTVIARYELLLAEGELPADYAEELPRFEALLKRLEGLR